MNKPKLSQSLSRKLYTTKPEQKVAVAYAFMKEKRVRHLIVVNQDDWVVGVLSDRDCQRAMKTTVEAQQNTRVISESFSEQDLVQDYMSWTTETVDIDMPIEAVASLFLEKKISSVLVTKDSEVSGIVTTDDLLWILVSLLKDSDDSILDKLKMRVTESELGSLFHTLSQAGI